MQISNSTICITDSMQKFPNVYRAQRTQEWLSATYDIKHDTETNLDASILLPFSMMTSERLAPSVRGSSAQTFFSKSDYLQKPSLNPAATPLPPFLLPTPPHTRSPSTSPASPAASSRRQAAAADAAATKARRHKTSTERKIERKRAENANYIPRPKNSFILFRTDFVQRHKKEAEVTGSTARAVAAVTTAALLGEMGLIRDDGQFLGSEEEMSLSLSKQASEVWNRMTEVEKQPWVDLAEKEKQAHAKRYPNYRYRPVRHGHSSPAKASSVTEFAFRSRSPSKAPSSVNSETLMPQVESVGLRLPDRLTESKEIREDFLEGPVREKHRREKLASELFCVEGGAYPSLSSIEHRAYGLSTPINQLAPRSVAAAQNSTRNLTYSSQPQLNLPQQASSALSNTFFLPLHSEYSLPVVPAVPTLPVFRKVPPTPANSAFPAAYLPIPRSPSAPIFDTRSIDAHALMSNASDTLRVGSFLDIVPTSYSAPCTPQLRTSSPLESASVTSEDTSPSFGTTSFSAHSNAVSPNADISTFESASPPADPSNVTSLQYNRSTPLDECYKPYDRHAALTSLPTIEQVDTEAKINSDRSQFKQIPTPLCHPQPQLIRSQVPLPLLTSSQKPLEAVADMWSQEKKMDDDRTPTAAATKFSYRAPLPLLSSPLLSAQSPTSTVTTNARASSKIKDKVSASNAITSSTADVTGEQMRVLTGLPSQTLSIEHALSAASTAYTQGGFYQAASLGCQVINTDAGIEAYQLGLGRVSFADDNNDDMNSGSGDATSENLSALSSTTVYGVNSELLSSGSLIRDDPSTLYGLGLDLGPGLDASDTSVDPFVSSSFSASSLFDLDFALSDCGYKPSTSEDTSTMSDFCYGADFTDNLFDSVLLDGAPGSDAGECGSSSDLGLGNSLKFEFGV